MAVPDAHLLLAVRWVTLESMSSTIPCGGRRPCTSSIHWPDKSAREERLAGAASPEFRSGPLARRCCVTVSRRPADNPTYRRIDAGARRISSKAAEHRLPQQTDQRMAAVPAGRASASVSPAISVKLSASSSSRYANNPASDVTADPQTGASGGGWNRAGKRPAVESQAGRTYAASCNVSVQKRWPELSVQRPMAA